MPGVRFTTARALFEAFPTARHCVATKPTDQASLDFLRMLMANDAWRDAVGFCSYLLPRREAVFWACHCVRALVKDCPAGEEAVLHVAERWVQEPEEKQRRAALEAATRGNQQSPATWAAYAAGWSGGVKRQSASGPVAFAPYETAHAARAAVLIALSRLKASERGARLGPLMDQARRLAEGADPR
jgi:hypothetical protein